MSYYSALPLFPLGAVLYPQERLPLHIFEPKYVEMVQHCLDHEESFGIVLEEEGRLADVGCVARIVRVDNRYPDGRFDLLIEGERRVRILNVYRDRAYPTAEAEFLYEPSEPLRGDLKERAITQHMKLLELAGRTVRPSLYQGVREVSFVLAHNAGLSLQQQQEVLELPSENDRIAYLVQHFEALIPRVEQIEDVRRKIQSNGHFKDFPPQGEGGGAASH